MQKNWFLKNWQWFIPCNGICILLLSVGMFSKACIIPQKKVQASKYVTLYQNAILQEKDNSRLQKLGNLPTISTAMVLQNSLNFRKKDSQIQTSIRLKGSKNNAILYIRATQKQNTWQYQNIEVKLHTQTTTKNTLIATAIKYNVPLLLTHGKRSFYAYTIP